MNINTETVLEATVLAVQQTLSFIKSEQTLGMPEAVCIRLAERLWLAQLWEFPQCYDVLRAN